MRAVFADCAFFCLYGVFTPYHVAAVVIGKGAYNTIQLDKEASQV